MNTPSGQLIRCDCCHDDVEERFTYIDPDLCAPVCPVCKTQLRWAQAYLKKANILPPPASLT